MAVDDAMDVDHTFPPELWEIICTELADQQDPRFHWKYWTSEIESARLALHGLYRTSKMLRHIAQPLLLRSRCTEEELGGFRSFGEIILSKPRLASLVRCIRIVPCPPYLRASEEIRERPLLEEAANRLGFDPSLFFAWSRQRRSRMPDLSPLAQLLPYFLPKLKYLHIKVDCHKAPCQILQTLRESSVVTPFESVTTLLLESTDDNLDGWFLQRYSPLLALLPNLRLLSLWNCDGILAAEDPHREWYDSGENIVEWMPKRLQSIHMRACRLSSPAITTLLATCHSLENFFYAPERSWLLVPITTTQARYRQIVQALRRSKDTLRYLDLDMGNSWLFGPPYDVDKDLAEMWRVLHEFPHVTYVSADGKGYQKRDSEPFDWVCVKNTSKMVDRTLDFQFAMEQAMGF